MTNTDFKNVADKVRQIVTEGVLADAKEDAQNTLNIIERLRKAKEASERKCA
jgi:hypothetical protein